MILGITGGSGSGKTTLLKTAEALGFLVLDCDAIYHNLLRTDRALLHAIESRFPGSVEDGQLQRKKLGARVFSDPDALKDLNAITHSAVIREVRRQLIADRHIAIDAAALFESGMDDLCDVTVTVTAPKEIRIARLMARDGISRNYAESRIDAQPRDDWYAEKSNHILVNDTDPGTFQTKCLAFFRQLGIM